VSAPGPKGHEDTIESAARTQLEAAIALWFAEGEPMPIQTLTFAALRKLHDLGARRDVAKPSPIISGILKWEKKDRDRMMLPIDFAKHGDRQMRDIESVTYAPEVAEHLMYEAMFCYANLFNNLTPLMRIFSAWFTLHNPELFAEIGIPSLEKFLLSVKGQDFTRMTRSEFRDNVLPLIA